MATEKRIAYAVGHTQPKEMLPEHVQKFMGFLEDFNKETERGAALSAAAYLDDLLGQILSSFCVPNSSGKTLASSEGKAPLGTFSARLQACHALGLISDSEFAQCDLVRKVRNEFAHKVKMSFENDRVKGLCSTFSPAAVDSDGRRLDPRGIFTSSAVVLIIAFTSRQLLVEKNPLKAYDRDMDYLHALKPVK